MKRIHLLVCFIFLFSSVCLCYGFDNKETHPEITKYAIQSSRLNTIIKEKFGLSQGIDSIHIFPNGITSRTPAPATILKIIQDGAYAEDVPNCRAQNHFHNPLLPWYLSRMGDPFLPISMYCTTQNPSYIPYYSDITWATGYTIPGSIDKLTTGNIWDWDHAREYYQLALTSVSQTERDRYFASTFEGIGKILHLLQDMAVPAHVRNDFTGHLEFSFESFPRKEGFEYFMTKHPEFTIYAPEALPTAVNITNSPYTNFWDSDLYDGTNPDITAFQGGLAEYTNANFLSKSTMFTDELNAGDKHYFPYPKGQNAVLWKDPTNKKMYYGKTGDGESVDHLATISLTDYYRRRYFPQNHAKLPVWLDDKCYAEYASKLIPKAVGFSAGLLNYFFRGTIEITPPDQYVYSIIDGSKDPQQFTKIKVKIKNTTLNESMLRGTLIAIAKFKKRTDYQPDLTEDPPGVNSMDSEFSYAISSPIGIESLSSMVPQEFIFSFNNLYSIPAGVTDLSLQIVFKGTLGNEKDNAIAVGYKDLMEPTHLVFWNLTDRFSMVAPGDTTWHLKTADEIRADQNLLDIVNAPPSAFIDPYKMTYDISYMGSSSASASAVPSARVKDLHEGNYIRLIVIVEKRSDTPDLYASRVHYLKLTTTDAIDAGAEDSVMSFLGAYNQTTSTDQGDIFYYTNVETFRTITQHFHTGILRCRPFKIDSVTGTEYCPYDDSEVITPPDLAPVPATLLNKDGTTVSD